MNEHTYKDNYFRGFGHGEYEALKAEQIALEAETTWLYGVTAPLRVQPLSDPMAAELMFADPKNTISKEILMDTVENTGLMLEYAGQTACLRDCAIPSLLGTAGISGLGIGRTAPDQLAIGITAFLTGSREKSTIMFRSGKVAAVLSSHYHHMPISELLTVCESLENTFGEAKFVGGSISHSMTTAEFEFPKAAAKITAAYNSVMTTAGRPTYGQIIPVVQFRASDTSSAAASMLTYLKIGPGHLLPIGGFKVDHKTPMQFRNGVRMTPMDKFAEEAELLFAKMEYDIADLIPKMLATSISYPGNSFVGLCKYAGIPQKWGGLIEEDVRADWPNMSECTFLDIYEELTRSTALAIRDGFDPFSKRVLTLEEGIAKIARNRNSWKKYDLPGTIAWTAGKSLSDAA